MNFAPNPIAIRPDPALLVAVGERLSLVLLSNRRLAQTPDTNFQARRRIEAVITGLIDALDQLDGGPSVGAPINETAPHNCGAAFRQELVPQGR